MNLKKLICIFAVLLLAGTATLFADSWNVDGGTVSVTQSGDTIRVSATCNGKSDSRTITVKKTSQGYEVGSQCFASESSAQATAERWTTVAVTAVCGTVGIVATPILGLACEIGGLIAIALFY